MKKHILIIITLLVITISGCSGNAPASSYDSYNTTAGDYATEEYSYNDAPSETISINPEIDVERKITKNYQLSMTTKDLETYLKELNTLIDSNKGYIQNSNDNLGETSYRYANLSIKIPSDVVEGFIEKLNDIGKINSKSLNTNDITNSYNQTESMLKSLKTQEQRLLELIDEAENVSDLITIESQLSNVRADIQYYTQTIEEYNNQISYSLIELNVNEIKDSTIYVEDNFINKMVNTFFDAINGVIYFIQGLILMIISIWPFIVIGILIFLLIRYILKKKKSSIQKE